MDTLHPHHDLPSGFDADRLDAAAGALWRAMERFDDTALCLRQAYPNLSPIVHCHAVSHRPLTGWTGLWRAFPSHLLEDTGTAHARMERTRALTRMWNRWCTSIEGMQDAALALANAIAEGPAGRTVRVGVNLAPSHKAVLANLSPVRDPAAPSTTKGGFAANVPGMLGLQAAARTLATLDGIGTGHVWRVHRQAGSTGWHFDVTAPTAADALRWAMAALDHDLGRYGTVGLWREEPVEEALAIAMGLPRPPRR